MDMIRTYTNTLLELKGLEQRFKLLQQRREVIYVKYLGVKSPNYEKIGSGKNWAVDNMSIFLDLISRVNPETGMSLDDELEWLAGQIHRLTITLKEMRKNLKEMEGLEFQLYRAIVINGQKATEAVQSVAEKNFMSEQRVWKYHYSKIREEVNKLKCRRSLSGS